MKQDRSQCISGFNTPFSYCAKSNHILVEHQSNTPIPTIDLTAELGKRHVPSTICSTKWSSGRPSSSSGKDHAAWIGHTANSFDIAHMLEERYNRRCTTQPPNLNARGEEVAASHLMYLLICLFHNSCPVLPLRCHGSVSGLALLLLDRALGLGARRSAMESIARGRRSSKSSFMEFGLIRSTPRFTGTSSSRRSPLPLGSR